MVGFEDVERLFFEEDLLVGGEIGGDRRSHVVGNMEDFFGERLRDKVRAFRFLYTVRRESCELGVVGGVVAAVGDEENLALASGISQALDVGKKEFRTGDVELAAGQHEIGLRIDFPEDGFVGGHMFR